MTTTEGSITLADGAGLYFREAGRPAERATGDGPRPLVVPNGIYLWDDLAPLAAGRRMVAYDVRNRGRSDRELDPARLARGVEQDVDDLDEVRRALGADTIDLLGHSYVGVTVAWYAARLPAHVGRVVQVAPMEPVPGAPFPPHLRCDDGVVADVMARLAALRAEAAALDPVERCRRSWAILRELYVVDRADAARTDWGRCELANERDGMTYFMQHVVPSIGRLALSPAALATCAAPVLIVHGRMDRSAPYGGARTWARWLPDARLVTIDRAAHAPWVEAEAPVLGAIATFLGGAWPDGAERVTAIDPQAA